MKLLIRAIWLAFKSSRAIGVGSLHVERAKAMTEARLRDDNADLFITHEDGKLSAYCDYLIGRCMKCHFSVTQNGTLNVGNTSTTSEGVILNEPFESDRQTFARMYPTPQDLIDAVNESIEAELPPEEPFKPMYPGSLS